MNRYAQICIVFFVFFAQHAIGQTVVAEPVTGMPSFGSFNGGDFDIVNLANLNVYFGVPIVAKAGRGSSFQYIWSYNSSVWYPNSGASVWQNVDGWGWKGQTDALVGYVRYFDSADVPCGQGSYTFRLFTYYADSRGTQHPFNLRVRSPNTCNPQTYPVTGYATDNSGYSITVASFGSFTVGTPSGAKVNLPNGTFIDSNGNEMTTDGTTFTDSLNVANLKVSGNPVSQFQVLNPQGQYSNITVTRAPYHVKTEFGCSSINGISDLDLGNVNLVNSIALPSSNGSYSFTYETNPDGTYTGRLASVTLPTGGTITYTYSGGDTNKGIMCSDGSTAGLTRQTPDGTWSYTRSGGVTTVTAPDASNSKMNVTFSGIFETQRKAYQGSVAPGNLLATTIKCYNANYANCATATVTSPITQTDIYTQLPNGSTRLSETVYNSNGLVTDDKEYDYGVAMGSAPGTAHLVRETATTYASLGNGIVDRPASVVVYDWTTGSPPPATLASTSYFYDQTGVTGTSAPQHIAITGARGNLTTLTQSTGSTSLSQTWTYYDTGNPNVFTDVNGAQTTYQYGANSCGSSFPDTILEPLSLSRSSVWNCNGGVPTQANDENSNPVKANYSDPDFWRPTATFDELNNQANISYIGPTATEAALNFGSSTSDTRTTMDGLGRRILSQRLQAPGGTNYDTVETDYNSVGLPSRTTMPFVALAGATNSTAPATQTTYDALGRVLTITHPDSGTVSYTYTNNDVLQQISGGQTFQKQFEYDGLGRLTSVCEITTASGSGTCAQSTSKIGYWTRYQYDAIGRLTGVCQNTTVALGTDCVKSPSTGQQTRKYSYDSLGRLTSELNPESSNLSTTYTYDTDSTCGTSKGDLVKRVDAASNVTCFAYDALHRKTAITYPTGPNSASTPSKTFVYDATTFTCGNGSNVKGRLAEAYTGPSTGKITDIGYCYSARGEATDFYESTPHSSGYYHVTGSYSVNGVLNTLNGVSLPTITYGLDGEGRPKTVSASSGVNPVSSTLYNSAGQVTDVTFGSADPVHFAYDSMGRMTQYKLTINGTATHGDPAWNPNGTLSSLAITDPFNASDAQTCNYGYDDLARLASVNCLQGTTNIWNQNFTYDPFGNITKSGTISWLPGYNQSTNQYLTSANCATTGAAPCYDQDGNLLKDGTDHAYTWDADGHPITLDSDNLVYDALGREVEVFKSGAYTEFAFGPTGKLALMNGQTQSKAFVPLPGGTQVKYAGNTISTYRLPDWLGSFRVGSNPNRTYSWGVAFAPFGEMYASSGSPAWSFTGEEGTADTVSDEYDFLARKLHSAQGRWISPDPAGLGAASMTNPQTWNRYAYVGNNPLGATDPTGLYEATCGQDCGDIQPPTEYGGQWSGSWGMPTMVTREAAGFFGDNWYDLPGQQNAAAQEEKAEGQYLEMVSRTEAVANLRASFSVNAHDKDLQCGNGAYDVGVVTANVSSYAAMTSVSATASEVTSVNADGSSCPPDDCSSSAGAILLGDPSVQSGPDFIPVSQSQLLGPQNSYLLGQEVATSRSTALKFQVSATIPYHYTQTVINVEIPHSAVATISGSATAVITCVGQ